MKTRYTTGFTLLEMLVAIAVVSLMMVFMFNMAGQTVRGWEAGTRRMEAAQSARIGVNLIATELKHAFAGSWTNLSATSSAVYNNFSPFVVTNGLPGETTSQFTAVPGSQSLFFVSTVGPHDAENSVPFAEIGYMPLFVNDPQGRHTMIGPRYYLVRHGGTPGTVTNDFQDFYYRSGLDSRWALNPATTDNRTPIVDNCIRFNLQFASNNSGTVVWTTNWTSQTNLPLGVLVTMLVLDGKSAARLGQVNGTTVLSAAQIDQATNGSVSTDPVVRILREGTTVVQRFVPLVNSGFSQ